MQRPRSSSTFELIRRPPGAGLRQHRRRQAPGQAARAPAALRATWWPGRRTAHVLSPAEAKALAREAAARPAEAERALLHAHSFRESLYRVLLALVEARPAPAADVARAGGRGASRPGRRRLECTARAASAGRAPAVCLFESVVPRLALVVASELLTAERLKRVRVCEATGSDGCGWLFLDQTRNHSRRWCSMATCGNKHKARRHYARVRGRS